MKENRPSITARKVAMSIITLSIKPSQDKLLPEDLAKSTERMLVASGIVGQRTIKLAKKKISLKIYNAFDWLLPGQFEALGARKVFCERHVTDAQAAK